MSLEVALENNDEWLGGQLGNGSKPSKAWADVEIDGTLIPFLRLGELITGGPSFPLTPDALKKVLMGQASRDVLLSIVHACRIVLTNPSQSFFAVAGLTIAAPVILTALYHVFVPTFRIWLYLPNSKSSMIFGNDRGFFVGVGIHIPYADWGPSSTRSLSLKYIPTELSWWYYPKPKSGKRRSFTELKKVLKKKWFRGGHDDAQAGNHDDGTLEWISDWKPNIK
ncbi:hypothetical protein HPP92_009048 [Vanilla planifolia]|uniref:Uncharacterized protein n=1 Tax=Vanilla planifolia TaxID=51239 RepID=A0A835V714_VANPL|nr:hypothetical protein HPP92_009048 [Vanilla planifolia]